MSVECRDGTTSWQMLASLKASYPVQVAEYALAAGIEEEPAIKWYVPHVLTKVNPRYHKRTHKFGFGIPKTVEHALRIDKEHGDDRWAKALKKETDKSSSCF